MSLRLTLSLVLSVSILFGGCFESEISEEFYGKVSVSWTQEFRWSDGGLPRVFDPARAAAPPDTDAVRALFEGLTDYERGTLRPVPAVASRWESDEGGRKWTFHLRANARWSNGDPVTAQDFVRSWQRTLLLGERAPHAKLLSNIEGAESLSGSGNFNAQKETASGVARGGPEEGSAAVSKRSQKQTGGSPDSNVPKGQSPSNSSQAINPTAFGVAALDAHTLRVTLNRADKNFPALVAHPVFRPVHELSPGIDLQGLQDEQREDGGASGGLGIVTNGAFSLSQLSSDHVELKRAESYWDVSSVKLERVLFVDSGDAEGALAAYRAGQLDAVTNASIAPVAVKLLTPYKDFRRGTFAALNYYSFNTSRPPFDDPRVREALACALDTERLSTDTLGGATEPAKSFLPPLNNDDEGGSANVATGEGAEKLKHDVGRARRLLDEAGYPGGVKFPRIKLLVNRNEQQRLVAQAVARMWREALGVETEIVVRSWEEYEVLLRAGDYDVVRRSLVMQTTDEETNMLALFGDEQAAEPDSQPAGAEHTPTPATSGAGESAAGQTPVEARRAQPILTEAQALRELPAIPLHFASSYALVKPYVDGFESNLLDAPALKNVSINNSWQPPAQSTTLRLARR